MNNSLFKGKSSRTKIFTVITILAVILLLCFNLLITNLGMNKLFILDMTLEGFYTLSDNMKAACSEILNATDENGNKKQIKITFCGDPDYLIANDDLRASYFMALNMQNMFDNVTVETHNIEQNPTAVSMYKTTSRAEIKVTDIIVSYGAKYRVLGGKSLWTTDRFSYNGEYRMVSALASLTSIAQPKAYFVTDHSETYYDPADPESEHSLATATLADLLTERGLTIKTLKLSEVDRIPEDCALLIINNPREDFVVDPSQFDRLDYVSDTEKLDRYIVSHNGSVIVNKAYDVELPNLESFLQEWGFNFSNSLVKDMDNCLADVGEEGTTILGVYQDEETDFGYGYYESYATLSSAPKMVFMNTGYIECSFTDGHIMNEPGTGNTTTTYTNFIGTSDKAVAFEGPASSVVTSTEGYKTLAAASVRKALDEVTTEDSFSYLFCTNSGDFFSNELLGNSSYANYDIMTSVVANFSRTDQYASMDLGGLSANSPNQGGKASIPTALSESPSTVYSAYGKEMYNNVLKENQGITEANKIFAVVVVAIAPVAALTVGVVVFIKRKFL